MEDRCVCCGEIIPEGRQVCPNCEHKGMETENKGLIDVRHCPCDGCKAKPCGHPARCVKFTLWLNKTVDAVEVDEVREFARDVAYQFGYYCQNRGRLHITHGGLSTLEWAFDILGWDNPHPVPECECEIDGCHEHATCGSPTADGYKRMCGMHMREQTAQTDEIDFDYEAED